MVFYDKNDEELGIYDVSESLHNEIFNSKKLWRSYLELRKLSDFYLTDETFSRERLSNLINDLNNYKQFVPENIHSEYEEIIKQLSNSKIGKVHIAGD